MKRTKLSIAIASLGLAAGGAYAQSATGQITGTVKDPSGAVIARVRVTVANSQTGLRRQALYYWTRRQRICQG